MCWGQTELSKHVSSLPQTSSLLVHLYFIPSSTARCIKRSTPAAPTFSPFFTFSPSPRGENRLRRQRPSFDAFATRSRVPGAPFQPTHPDQSPRARVLGSSWTRQRCFSPTPIPPCTIIIPLPRGLGRLGCTGLVPLHSLHLVHHPCPQLLLPHPCLLLYTLHCRHCHLPHSQQAQKRKRNSRSCLV